MNITTGWGRFNLRWLFHGLKSLCRIPLYPAFFLPCSRRKPASSGSEPKDASWPGAGAICTAIRESGLFEEAYYRRVHPDLAQVEDALGHFVAYGAAEGRRPSAAFDTAY